MISVPPPAAPTAAPFTTPPDVAGTETRRVFFLNGKPRKNIFIATVAGIREMPEKILPEIVNCPYPEAHSWAANAQRIHSGPGVRTLESAATKREEYLCDA